MPFIRNHWFSFVTAAVLLLAALILVFSKNIEQAAHIGEFISGFASALAFLWLIASFQMQSREIASQREELKLQRTALEGQARELRNASKFSSLVQIGELIDRANGRVKASALVKDETELVGLFMGAMPSWKVILESKNAQVVQDQYREWLKIEGLLRGYLSSIAMALRIYLEYFVLIEFDRAQSDEEFVYVYQTWMNKVPYLMEHSANAFLVANCLFMFQPGLKAMQLAGLTASKLVLGQDLFKEGALEKMKKELIERGTPVPAIAEDL